MLLLAEYVPATMLDPKALGTALEFHILTFIEQYSGPQGRRRCLAAGVLDIWHGTDPPDLGTAWHGTSLPSAWIAAKTLISHKLSARPLQVFLAPFLQS